MRTSWLLLALPLAVVLPGAAAAQGLDCAKHIKGAEAAIDKVTEDMKGMESMPKEQLRQVHSLLDDARGLLTDARQGCAGQRAEYERARAIAKAEGARGSAEAADMLHFHFMKSMHGKMDMKPATGTSHGHSGGGMSGGSMPGMKH